MSTQPPTVIQADEMRGLMLQPLRNWDERFTFYYDETNNIRRLRLSEVGLNASDNKTFVLAGISLRAGRAMPAIDGLRANLRLQGNAPELKAKHVADGNFEAMLASRDLQVYLTWLLDHDLLVHYSALDVLYWSLTDIVDTLMAQDDLVAFHQRTLKNELHDGVRRDPVQFFQLLHGFGYPDLQRTAIGPFMTAVVAFLERQASVNRNREAALLKDRLRAAASLKDLPFLHDNDKGELIPNFAPHFLRSVYVFQHAAHVFDQETYVQKALQTLEVRAGARRLDYRFVDSRSEPGVQLSDVIANLFGKYFTFLQLTNLTQLLARRAAFTQMQQNNLALLRELIDRSDAASNGFCHTIVPLDTNFKSDAFLYDHRVPNHLLE
ncbi:MAG: DUF3800 domain-containing protein [Ramlibacter sp.]|nr:DUF3800 domain-containing protein [Ramlibacter sp.]